MEFSFKKYILVFFIAFSFTLSAQPLHEYFYNNSLAGTAGGPTLTQNLACAAAAGAYGSQTITTSSGNCSVATVFCFNQGGGLSYPNPSYITNQYTINLFFKFNNLGGWSRIIDFSNSTADAGIYLLVDCLNFYPNGNVGTCPYFVANTYYLFTFVRDGATSIISVYVNGNLFGTYNDAGNLYMPATNTTPIIFFRDDNPVPCEAKPGCVKYTSITSATTSAAQVATTWTNICSVVLPIELSRFDGVNKEDKVFLNWATESENNNKLFEIERSADAINFLKIGEVKGNGDSQGHIDYGFTDPHPNKGVNYYRLNQINYDGSSKHSTLVSLDFDKELPHFYPNPAGDFIMIDVKNKTQKISIKNLLGEEVFTLTSVPENGRINLDALQEGSYLLSVGDINYKLIIKK